jgi:hypothetical protein
MSSRVTDGFAGSPHGIVYAVETHGDLAAAQYSSILKYDLGSGRTGRDRDDVVTRYRIRDARREDADILAPASQRFTRLTIGTIGAPTCLPTPLVVEPCRRDRPQSNPCCSLPTPLELIAWVDIIERS